MKMRERMNTPKKMVGINQMRVHKMLKSHKKRSKMKRNMVATREMTVSKMRTKGISKAQIIKRIKI